MILCCDKLNIWIIHHLLNILWWIEQCSFHLIIIRRCTVHWPKREVFDKLNIVHLIVNYFSGGMSFAYKYRMSTLNITLWLWPLRKRTCFIAKMTLNPEELKILLCSSWRTEFKNWSRSDLLRYRQLRLRAMDGREMRFFYPWPTEMRRILFKNHSPPSDRETMHLFVFLVGNGLSAYRSGTWIITIPDLGGEEMRWFEKGLRRYVGSIKTSETITLISIIIMCLRVEFKP